MLLERDDEYEATGVQHTPPANLHIFDLLGHQNITLNSVTFKAFSVPLDFDGN